jgi:ATP/maltotriose-dependent transcriptional regulator MalT
LAYCEKEESPTQSPIGNKAWKIRPTGMNAEANLAWVLATSPDAALRDGAKAVELAKEIIKRTGHADDVNRIIVLRTLAAGYAETGRFAEAVESAQQASQLAIAQGNIALTQDLQSNIARYRRNFHYATLKR